MPTGTKDLESESDVYIQGKDGVFTKLGKVEDVELTPSENETTWLNNLINDYTTFGCEKTLKAYEDLSVKRLIASIIDERFASNNWRKLHGLPMWRLR